MGRKGEHGKRLKEPCRRQWLQDAHRGGGAIKMVVRLEKTEKDDPQRDLAREGERGIPEGRSWVWVGPVVHKVAEQ